MKINSSQPGFSLIELIVYIAIIGALLTAYISFSLNTSNFRSKIQAVNEVQNNARIALRSVSQIIRSAESIDISSSTFDSDPGILVLNTRSSSTNPTIIDLNKNDGSLRVTAGTSTPYFLTGANIFVTNLIFRKMGESKSKININVEASLRYNFSDPYLSYEDNFETNVSIRN